MTLRALVLACGLAALACDGGRVLVAHATDDPAGADEFKPWFGGPSYYAGWSRGLPSDERYFPIGVWLQEPRNAARFAAIGVNLFVGLWEGPTDEQLGALSQSPIRTFCDQAGGFADHLEDHAIAGWMQPDTPDDAQLEPDGSYGPCTPPARIQQNHALLRSRDPTRPVYLGLGRGVAELDWEGRGSCAGATSMYSEYAQAADVLGFHVYPIFARIPLTLPSVGIDHLVAWSAFEKPVFALVEASRIDGVARPTPAQLRFEVWSTLIHGAAGIVYYCHQQSPVLVETDCLDDAPSAAALDALDVQLEELAPALNAPTVINGLETRVEPAGSVSTRLSRSAGNTYVFAAEESGSRARVTFNVLRTESERSVEVLGENRNLTSTAGIFSDDFAPYTVHLYRLAR